MRRGLCGQVLWLHVISLGTVVAALTSTPRPRVSVASLCHYSDSLQWVILTWSFFDGDVNLNGSISIDDFAYLTLALSTYTFALRPALKLSHCATTFSESFTSERWGRGVGPTRLHFRRRSPSEERRERPRRRQRHLLRFASETGRRTIPR